MVETKKIVLVLLCFSSMASCAGDSAPSNELNNPEKSYNQGVYDANKVGLLAGGAIWAGILGKWAYDSYWRKPIHVIIANLKQTNKYIDTVLNKNNSEKESRQLSKGVVLYLRFLSSNIAKIEKNLQPGAKKPKKGSRTGYFNLKLQEPKTAEPKIKEKK